MKYVIPRCSVSLPLNSFAKSACGFTLSPKNNPIDESPSDPNAITSATFAEDVEVLGAELKDGLLTVELEKIIPEHKKPRSITIK